MQFLKLLPILIIPLWCTTCSYLKVLQKIIYYKYIQLKKIFNFKITIIEMTHLNSHSFIINGNMLTHTIVYYQIVHFTLIKKKTHITHIIFRMEKI